MQQPQRRSFWRWYKSRNILTKLGIGCASLLLVLSLCICSAAAAASGNHQTSVSTSQPTSVVTHAAVVTATLPKPSPTLKPTPSPTPTKAIAVHPTSTPKPQPTQRPTPTHCVGVNNNPWCYDFNPGNKIYSPPSSFCSYFQCVSTFWTATRGYVAECANGSYTHSAGVSGACSRDGGVAKTLYSH